MLFVRADCALFLDVDGTLLDLATAPDMVATPCGLVRDLERLHGELKGALALLSGRAIADLDRLLSPLRLATAGQHGAELRVDAEAAIERLAAVDLSVAQRRQLDALVERHPGVFIEDKGLSIAVHYRAAPEAAAALARTLNQLAAADSRLGLQRGHCVIEIKPRGTTKGTALLELMRHPAFHQRMPIAVGDDLTDEDAFSAALSLGGRALRVGTAGLANPAEVRRWLSDSADVLRTSRAGA